MHESTNVQTDIRYSGLGYKIV